MHDEFERIDWLKARLELDGQPRGTVIGIGDDAAVLEFEGPTVLTVDTQVEGTHFRRNWLTPADLGWRALVAAASDVLAMGAVPHAALSALCLPLGYSEREFASLIEGIADAAKATGARVIGGNLSSAKGLAITTTVLGTPLVRPLGRAGAAPGDTVYVTGTLGSAALGLRMLDAGALDIRDAATFVDRWRRPPDRGALVATLAQVATASIDVSDGCLQDLGHLCRASDVGSILRADALPLDAGFAAASRSLGADHLELALTGGEDYELLFSAPRSSSADAIGTAIGSIVEGDGVRVLDTDGRPLTLGAEGFRHFS